MFKSMDAKLLSTQVRLNVLPIVGRLDQCFSNSIVGVRREVQFFRNLIREIHSNFSNYAIGGLKFECRIAETHQKPIVVTQNFSCELADLLVVLKYHLPGGVIERKSLLYQVKLCSGISRICPVDQNQLTLLADWPQFSFGRVAGGGPKTYNIVPNTIEFGSYLIMLRSPTMGVFLPRKKSYGVAPNSLLVRAYGGAQVDIATIPYSLSEVHQFFGHMAFIVGEHHDFNSNVAGLVDALYRYLGLAPDPPNEFEGFYKEKSEEEMGFGIIEISVSIEGTKNTST